MDEIKVGEYCRSKYGEIGIVTKIWPQIMWRKKKNPSLLDFNEIKLHSKNIIELIEPRDFVNEMIVDKDCNGLICTDINGDFHYLDKIQIKTILTREMYEQNCYKVGDIE